MKDEPIFAFNGRLNDPRYCDCGKLYAQRINSYDIEYTCGNKEYKSLRIEQNASFPTTFIVKKPIWCPIEVRKKNEIEELKEKNL